MELYTYKICRWDPILLNKRPKPTFSIIKTNLVKDKPIHIKVIVEFTSIYGISMMYNNQEFDGILYNHSLLPAFSPTMDIIVLQHIQWCDYPDPQSLGICTFICL